MDALNDEDIDLPDIPEVTPRTDADVLVWFKSQGKRYQTRINTLLRAFMQTHNRE